MSYYQSPPPQHALNSPKSMFSIIPSKSISNVYDYPICCVYTRASSVPFSPLYQSSTIAASPDYITEAKVSDRNKTLPVKSVKFAARNISDKYTPISEHSNTFCSITPPISRSSSLHSIHPVSGMVTISSSRSYSNVHSAYPPSIPHNIPPADPHVTRKVKPCPNMVNGKCRCKEKLSESHAAQLVWSDCYRLRIRNKIYATDTREIEVSYFDGLYKGLCQYLRQEVDSDRVPTKRDMSNIIQQFGGFTLQNGEVIMDRCHFVSFWRWFHEACQILKEMYHLWDTKYPFQLNLFMDRKQCEQILSLTDDGTFLVRLSSRPNALVVSYSEQISDRTTKIRHILLVRTSSNEYMVKTNKKSQECCDINKLIRLFAKLRFIYTPNRIYKKNHVF